MVDSYKIINLREESDFLEQYIELRNQNADFLLTKTVTIKETREWIKQEGIEIRGLASSGILLGVVVLYLKKGGEIAFFTWYPNRGTGSMLLKAIEEVAKAHQISSVWAWVSSDNAIAKRVFLKNGYRVEMESDKTHNRQTIKGILLKKNVRSTETKMEKKSTIDHMQTSYGVRPEALAFPLMCVVSFTYVCNAACPNCPYTNSRIRSNYADRPFISEETFKTISDQCGEYGAWVRISGGGEPMLHPKAVELIEYARKADARVGLITNGSRFTEKSSIRLLEAQVDMIEFSVDAADPETYALVRKGLNWERLLKNVKRIVALRNKLKSKTKIIASGVNQVGVNIEKVAAFWDPIVDDFRRRKYLTWGINDPARSADPTPYLPPEKMIPCPFIFERLNIDSRGRVMVCGFDIAGVTDMGNVHERSIKDIWRGREFEGYRQRHLAGRGSEIALCKDCPDWKYRSWQHNYWKVVRIAEKRRIERFDRLPTQDSEGCISEMKKIKRIE